MAKVILKDGSVRDYDDGITAAEIIRDISPRLLKASVAAKVNGSTVSLSTPISGDAEFTALTFDDEEGQKTWWHTSSHIMAQAVLRLFPDTKFAIGPAIDNGFYYDFDVEKPFTPEDLIKIEKEMKKIVDEKIPIEHFTLPKDEAIEFMKDQPYKVELINDLPDGEIISFYKQGDFTDLCAGPHLMSTGAVRAFKLLSVAGAYWRGSEKNKMLQRIYAVSFPKKGKLDEYIHKLEEAKKRDHRKLGKELDLFMMAEEGPGFPFFLPKGMIIKNQLIDFWRDKHKKAGYQEVSTPIILNEDLWHKSGHWDNYKENMYFTQIDGADYAIKPMNCPGGMLAFNRKLHSYRELPLKMAELGLVHRHELSGALHGLIRVRSFIQDDAHIFMLPSQIKEEIINVINLIDDFYSVFGFEYYVELSTKPEKAIGSDEDWELATDALRDALIEKDMKYSLNEGDGAFYGPKIDFHLEDSLGRSWQCGTIQLDFQMPERFDLNYIGADGDRHRPVMIHRTVFGSIERFIGILIEHYAGAFPVWLSPVQAIICSITDRANDYINDIADRMRKQGIRVELDLRNEKIGYKIREARNQRIPYIMVVGDREIEENAVAVRRRGNQNLGAISADDAINMILEDVDTLRID